MLDDTYLSLVNIRTSRTKYILKYKIEVVCSLWLFYEFAFCSDSTNQYIHGQHSDPTQGVYSSGLHTVTVLIGVFLKSTGEPIAGVINQPFCYKHESV